MPGPGFPDRRPHLRPDRHRAGVQDRPRQRHHARPDEVEKGAGQRDREQIVVTEIPYQVNKARLHAKIGELMRDKRIEGINEVRDESDRDGMRLVIELKKDVFPQVVLNQLYRLTDMQASFGVINLVDRQRPARGARSQADARALRRAPARRRQPPHALRARQAEAQREIVEGLGMAVTEVDLVVKTIRESRDPEAAREALDAAAAARARRRSCGAPGGPEAEIAEAASKRRLSLSERQAKAILEMRLSRLTGLEQEKLAAEYGELCDEIARLRAILADEQLLMDLIVTELEEVKEKHAETRRTEIVDDEAEIQIEDLIQEEDMVVTISHAGYIKRTPLSAYRAQKRGGKGKRGMEARDEDLVTQLFVASTHTYVFFFSDRGKVYVKKVYEIPQAARNAKGRAIVNFIGMEPGEKVAAITPVPEFREGAVRDHPHARRADQEDRASLEYENYREKGIIGVKIEDDDQLLTAVVTDGTASI